MKENKTLEKELLFKNNIKEITSISLDSDYKVNDKEITGNFLISGEYKLHEISINKEKFNFKIPFKQEIDDNVDLDTVKLEILNFIYDYKKDELIVNIEYEITGDKKDVLLFDDEKSLDEFLESRELEVIDTRLDDINEEINKKEEIAEDKKDEDDLEIKENVEEKDETVDKEFREEESRENVPVETEEIIENINNISDKFVTYKIYKLTENDTLENLVIRYHTTLDELKEYNDLSNIKVNDKLIIPIYE